MTDATCGSCTMCCKLMGVPELDKPPGEWCKHCDPKVGCTIYDDRPESCKDFECLWLQAQSREVKSMLMGPGLKPNQCKGVIVTTTKSEGLVIKVDKHRSNALLSGPLQRLVRGTPKLIWMVQPGGRGPAKALNETAIRACYKQGLDPNRIIAKDEQLLEQQKRKQESEAKRRT